MDDWGWAAEISVRVGSCTCWMKEGNVRSRSSEAREQERKGSSKCLDGSWSFCFCKRLLPVLASSFG